MFIEISTPLPPGVGGLCYTPPGYLLCTSIYKYVVTGEYYGTALATTWINDRQSQICVDNIFIVKCDTGFGLFTG